MSQENIDTVRRAYEVWNEFGPTAVTERFWADDAVYREGAGWPNAGVYRGRDAALKRMRSLVDLLGPIEVRIVGAGAGDAPYTQSFAVVQRLRDGLIVEADYYLDRTQALQAVGLRD